MAAHFGDRLSALLDGELAVAEARAVRAHLAECPPCAAELEAVDAARSVLRGLPPVEPPAGFLDGLAPRPAPVVPLRRRGAAASAVASVAASILVVALGAGGLRSPLAPSVSSAVDDHASTVAALADAGLGVRPTSADAPPTTAVPRTLEGLAAPYRAPLELDGGYRLVRAFAHREGLHLLYQRGRFALSVFEAEGEVEWDALPGGRRLDHDGLSLWQQEGAGRVVVLEHDGLAATVVGDEGGEAVLEAARSLPGPRSLSLLQRVQRASSDALDGFSPLG